MLVAVNARIRRREGIIIGSLVVVAVVLRGLLVAFAPTPFGYVWDFYADGIRVLYTEGRLPLATDCWQCFHPPFFFIAGLPFYSLGKWIAPESEVLALRLTGALSLMSAAVTIYYGYRLLRLYRCRGASLVIGTALLLAFPCLFIGSYGAEADILLTAILSAFTYYLARYAARPTTASLADAARLGVLVGLAASTKASGLASVVTLAVVMGGGLLAARNRRRALHQAALSVLIVMVLGSWRYVDNWLRYGDPLHANGTASAGFSLTSRANWGREYEFTTFRLGALRRAIGPHPQTGTNLTDLVVYDSVLTTLHALAWSDMSFFSVRSRHGSAEDPYPWKSIPPNLTLAVILLGFVPSALAILGFVATLTRWRLRPLAVFGLVTVAAYVWWLLPQPSWALKTKYILFLLPQYILYVAVGLAWLTRRVAALGVLASSLLIALLALLHVYLYAFAVSRLDS